MIRTRLSLVFLLLSILFQSFFSQNQTLKSWFDSPINGLYPGQVNSIVVEGNTAYLGGKFTQCGFSTGFGVAVDTGTADANHFFPKFYHSSGSGWVSCSVPDNNGGWYIGGTFNYVNGQLHKYVAHIRADKSVDPWNPSPNQYVTALYFTGSRLYVGGLFDTIANNARGCGAAFDTAGNLLQWNPQATGSSSFISAIQPVGGIVYIGGNFGGYGGQGFRMILGAVDSSVGTATSWVPNPTVFTGGSISNIVYANHRIYVCGGFAKLDTVTIYGVAKFDENGVLYRLWKPTSTFVGNSVNTICYYGGKLYVGGDFTAIGGQTRNRLAAIDTGTGLATSWNPAAPNDVVRSLAGSGSKLYVGGSFTSIGPKSISYLAAVDTETGSAYNWNPGLNERVFDLAVSGSTVYAGGYFRASGVTTRNRLAAIDLGTGRLKPWNPNANQEVFALATANGKIYAGGSFTQVGSTSASLVTLDTLNGAVVAGVNRAGYFLALAVTGNRLYAGTNNGMSVYNIISGQTLSFHPTFDYTVINTVYTAGSTVYAAGPFSMVNGQSRSNVAAFDTTTDLLTSWKDSLSSTCYAVASNGSNVYLGGSFGTINGHPSASIAEVDATSGNLLGGFTSYFTLLGSNPYYSGYKVSSIAANGNQLYVGGQFSPVGSVPGTNFLTTLDATTGAVSSFRSGIFESGAEVTSIVLLPQTVLLGGSFITMLGIPQQSFAVLTDTSINNISPLPVELTSFSASILGQSVQLQWQTATEVNNYGFGIERRSISSVSSLNGWQIIGFIPGSGTSNTTHRYSFSDILHQSDRVAYRLKQIDNSGLFKYSNSVELDLAIPSSFTLSQNYPNPFNPTTDLSFQLATPTHVSLKVYDVLGKEISNVVDEYRQAGVYHVLFDASRFASGIYFYTLQAGSFIQTRKMMLMK